MSRHSSISTPRPRAPCLGSPRKQWIAACERLGSGASLSFHLIDEEEERALVRTHDSSIRDGLTGVFNLRHLEERLASETAFALRHGTDLSVVMIELDHFKRIDDARGHLAGDAALRHVATLISALVRMEDIVARRGGEQLCVVMRGVGVEGVALLGERIRASIEGARILFEGAILRVTASAGTSSERGTRTAAGLIARASTGSPIRQRPLAATVSSRARRFLPADGPSTRGRASRRSACRPRRP